MKKLKVFTWSQARAWYVCAAPSMAAVARIVGQSARSLDLCQTGNKQEVALALANPLTVLSRPYGGFGEDGRAYTLPNGKHASSLVWTPGDGPDGEQVFIAKSLLLRVWRVSPSRFHAAALLNGQLVWSSHDETLDGAKRRVVMGIKSVLNEMQSALEWA